MKAESKAFPEHIDQYLSDHNVMNLCTVGEDGPWSAAVFFAHHGKRFYFMSNPDTTHGEHINADPIIAASIHEDYAAWQDIKGVQMRGRCWVVTDRFEWKSGLRAYFRKYSFVEDFFKGEIPDDIAERMKGIKLYCFEPEVALWIDNSTGFGNRIQIFPEEGLETE